MSSEYARLPLLLPLLLPVLLLLLLLLLLPLLLPLSTLLAGPSAARANGCTAVRRWHGITAPACAGEGGARTEVMVHA